MRSGSYVLLALYTVKVGFNSQDGNALLRKRKYTRKTQNVRLSVDLRVPSSMHAQLQGHMSKHASRTSHGFGLGPRRIKMNPFELKDSRLNKWGTTRS